MHVWPAVKVPKRLPASQSKYLNTWTVDPIRCDAICAYLDNLQVQPGARKSTSRPAPGRNWQLLLGMFWNVSRLPSESLQVGLPQTVKAAALEIAGAGAARAKEARRGMIAKDNIVTAWLIVLTMTMIERVLKLDHAERLREVTL
jgi:hypothetical protein